MPTASLHSGVVTPTHLHMFGIAECLQCCSDLDCFLFTSFLSLWLEQLMSWLWRHGVHLKGPLLYRNKIPETLKHQDLYEYLPPQIVSSHTFIKKNKQLWLSVSLALHIKTGCYQSLLDKFRRQLSLSTVSISMEWGRAWIWTWKGETNREKIIF